MKKEDTIIFFDLVGRTIIGEKVSEEGEFIKVKNPVIVHIVPNQQTGQMALQLFPAFFKEFQADKNEDTVWNYRKCQLTLCDPIDLDFRLYSQYENMFSNIAVPQGTGGIVTPNGAPAEDSPIKLFD